MRACWVIRIQLLVDELGAISIDRFAISFSWHHWKGVLPGLFSVLLGLILQVLGCIVGSRGDDFRTLAFTSLLCVVNNRGSFLAGTLFSSSCTLSSQLLGFFTPLCGTIDIICDLVMLSASLGHSSEVPKNEGGHDEK
ncbi:hypothetical protein ACW185_03075 [Limosilactobacillus fermentum]